MHSFQSSLARSEWELNSASTANPNRSSFQIRSGVQSQSPRKQHGCQHTHWPRVVFTLPVRPDCRTDPLKRLVLSVTQRQQDGPYLWYYQTLRTREALAKKLLGMTFVATSHHDTYDIYLHAVLISRGDQFLLLVHREVSEKR
jgi:hypothetical protein